MRAVVLRAPGINCDYESLQALREAGFNADALHINEFIESRRHLVDYHFLFLPGGFSYGDYLGSAKVLANKLVYRMKNELPHFIEEGNLVLGVCNGFQALIKSGVLPGFDMNYNSIEATLSFNDSGLFKCEWHEIENVNKGKCAFIKGIEKMYVPIAHGEGKFIPKNEEVLQKLYNNDQVVFKYKMNPSGSVDSITGICDSTGRVLGMMPHPERNIYSWQNPKSSRMELPEEGDGLKLFSNAYNYLKR